MTDDIVISGGGSTQVAPDRLLDAESRLAHLADELEAVVRRLRPATMPQDDPHAARLAHSAQLLTAEASDTARDLAHRLRDAAESYGEAERRASERLGALGELGGWLIGALAPYAGLLATAAAPGLLIAAFLAFAVGAVKAGGPGAFRHELGAAVRGHAGLLRDPRVVSLIRLAVSSTDDGMLAALGVPPALTRMLGDRRSGLVGVHGAAAVIVGAGRLTGLFRETPIAVSRTGAPGGATRAVAPPSTYSDLAARIPRGADRGAQVRVEKYAGTDGKPTYLVYIGGTVTMSPVAKGEPFDFASDLAGIAQLDPAAVRTADEAMRQAGVRPGDTVIPIGYSQGGIVATDIVTSQKYDTPALVTFGSPTAGIYVPPNVADVAVEHTDDLVPALGGEPRAFDHGGGDRILVTRQTFSGAVPLDSSPVAAHQLTEYTETAGRMDASSDPRLAAALATLPIAAGGEETTYRGVRVSDASSKALPTIGDPTVMGAGRGLRGRG